MIPSFGGHEGGRNLPRRFSHFRGQESQKYDRIDINTSKSRDFVEQTSTLCCLSCSVSCSHILGVVFALSRQWPFETVQRVWLDDAFRLLACCLDSLVHRFPVWTRMPRSVRLRAVRGFEAAY